MRLTATNRAPKEISIVSLLLIFKILRASCVLLCFPLFSFGQVGAFESFTSDFIDGKQINSIAPDAKGFVWLSDGNEVFRFDGHNFETPINWCLPNFLQGDNDFITGLSLYDDHSLFLQSTHRILLFDLITETFEVFELKDSSDLPYHCIAFQTLGPGDLLLHCWKEQTEQLTATTENVFPEDREMVFLRFKNKQLSKVDFPHPLLYNDNSQQLRLPWCTIDAKENKYLFYDKHLMIWDSQGHLLEDFNLEQLCQKEDCAVQSQFDPHQQLLFTYDKKFYSLQQSERNLKTCGDFSSDWVIKGNEKSILSHCINSVLESNQVNYSDNRFVLNKKGDLFFYENNRHLIHFDGVDLQLNKLTESYENYGVFSHVLAVGNGNDVWVGGSGVISTIAPVKQFYDFYENKISIPNHSRRFKALVEGPSGNFYALIQNNILQCSPETGEVKPFALEVGVQRDLLATEKGLWLSNGQFYDFEKDSLLEISGAHPRKELNGDLYEERQGGTFSVKYNRDSTSMSGVGPALYQTLKEYFTELLVADEQQNIWRANDSTLYRLNDKGDLPEWETILTYDDALTENTWLTTFHYGQQSGLLWLGFDSGKLLTYDPAGKQLNEIPLGVEQEGLYIQDVLEYKDGILWISTSTALLKFSLKDGLLKRYGEDEGLWTQDNGKIIPQGDSILWLETRIGLTRFDVKNEVFYCYTEEDGLTYSMENGCTSAAGKFYFTINHNASENGIVSFEPNLLLEGIQKEKEAPQLVLSSIEYSDELEEEMIKRFLFAENETIHLYHWNKVIQLQYSLTGYPFPDRVRYSYRLKGVQDFWDNPRSFNFTRFFNLRSGAYNFEVRAQNENGVWFPDQLNLKLVVHPPWWKTKLAYLFYALLSAVLLYSIFTFFKKRIELRNQLRAEQREATRLKELDSFKSKLYTNLTHEFRTPLTVILGLVRKVREEPEKFLQEGTHIIERNSKSLLRIINQLLDLSKLEDQSFQLQLQQAEIISYLHYITESFHSYANGKNLSLRFFATDETLIMDYDPEQIQQVMTNLISNAIKFTPSGGEVFVRVFKNEEHLEIEVSDTGAGIPTEKIAFIFDRFYQVDSSTTREGEGTGIGLSHTHELVKLMGGNILVESTLGKGSKFVVNLPIKREAPTATKISAAVSPVVFEKKAPVDLPQNTETELPTLLIIEDNPDVVLYLKSCLESSYQLDVAYNGFIGVEKALHQIPDLIVSDVMMPGMDGFEVCNTLKNDERTSHIPIILLTAKADISSKLAGLERGADAYLAKPFHQEELLIRLKKLFEVRKRMSESFAKKFLSSSGFAKSEEIADHKKDLQIENAFIQKVNTLLETHIEDEYFGLPDLCQKVGMSRSQLFRKLKALTGIAPSAYIRKYRLQKAKHLLENADLNVAEAAFAVGFKDPSYFSKIFQEEFGINPSATNK